MKFIVVISGKTCSGKSYLLDKMLKNNNNYVKLVTSTSRYPRAGEKDGVDYNFIQSSLAEHYIDSGKFIESNVHGGHIYGLTTLELENKLQTGNIPCIILTPNGLETYKKVLGKIGISILSFYIDCPEDLLFTRLAKRTQEEIAWGSIDQLTAIKTSLLRVKDMVLKENDWDSYKDEFDFIINPNDEDPLNIINNKIMVYSSQNK